MTKVKRIALNPQSDPTQMIESLCGLMWDAGGYRLASTFTVADQLMLIFQKLDSAPTAEGDGTE